jgi:hypothetical protein
LSTGQDEAVPIAFGVASRLFDSKRAEALSNTTERNYESRIRKIVETLGRPSYSGQLTSRAQGQGAEERFSDGGGGESFSYVTGSNTRARITTRKDACRKRAMGRRKDSPEPTSKSFLCRSVLLTSHIMNIVLVHGILGFREKFGIEYFRNVAEHFREKGFKVIAPILDPTQGVDYRGGKLRDQINAALA